MGGNRRLLHRLTTISKLSASMHQSRTKPLYLEVIFWGVPTGLTFKSATDIHVLTVAGIKKACPAEGRNALQFGDALIEINGQDVRGKLATEVKNTYRRAVQEQGKTSGSQAPPRWTMIFRRGIALESEENMAPHDLCVKHAVTDAFDDALDVQPERNTSAAQEVGQFKTKIMPFMKKLSKTQPTDQFVEL